jgi:hypothetical protein
MTGNHTSQALHVVALLGGRAAATDITGYNRTLVESWLRGGWIHGKYHCHILESAWAAGIAINELDFVVHLRGLTRPAPTPERTAAFA